MAVVGERVHRQELHGRDAKALEMLDRMLVREPGVGAAQFRRHPRMTHGKALDVQLVDHRVLPGNARRAVVFPVVCGVDNAAFRHSVRIISAVEGQILVLVADAISEVRVAPYQLSGQALGVGVDQQLVGVESVTVVRPVRAMDAVAVKHARAGLRQIAVPDVVGPHFEFKALQLMPSACVEEAQFHFLGMGRKQGEIDTLAVPGRTDGEGLAWPYCGDWTFVHCEFEVLPHVASGVEPCGCIRSVQLMKNCLEAASQ